MLESEKIEASRTWLAIYDDAQRAMGSTRSPLQAEALAQQLLLLGRFMHEPLPETHALLMEALHKIQRDVASILGALEC